MGCQSNYMISVRGLIGPVSQEVNYACSAFQCMIINFMKTIKIEKLVTKIKTHYFIKIIYYIYSTPFYFFGFNYRFILKIIILYKMK